MNVSLEELRHLADNILSVRDDRPQKLKDLPSAMDEGISPFGRYYRFFWELCKRWDPGQVLEIGTYKGSSIAHLAAGNPLRICVTVDIEADAARLVGQLGLPNIIAITGDSAAMVDKVQEYGTFDLLFIDALHDFNHCYGEYLHYRPLVKPGGLLFFDDIHVHPEMTVAWDCVPDPKVELPTLHWTGFGVAKKDPAIEPLPWADVVGEASKRWKGGS